MSIKKYITLIFSLLGLQLFYGQQLTNKDVVAKIKTEEVNDLINIKATANNTQDDIKSLRYEMVVVKTNPETNNISRSKQSGSFILEAFKTKELSTVSINKNGKDKITILLFIYGAQDKLLGKDRIVAINDDEPAKGVKQQAKVEKDGAFIRGIVTDNTKTKSGRDFYRKFYSEYLLANINAKQIINIEEKLSLGRNTNIIITADGKQIHQFPARPNTDYITQMAAITFAQFNRYKQEIKNQKTSITQY